MDTVQIKTHHFLQRDLNSKAIINTDSTTRKALREKRNRGLEEIEEKRRYNQEIQRLNGIVVELKNDMQSIKESLKIIAGTL